MTPDPTWIFGYGSLMWDGWETGHSCTQRSLATLHGYARVFNKASVKNWGSKEKPGPTLNLQQCSEAFCRGMAFRFEDGQASAVISYLRGREGKNFALTKLQVALDGDHSINALVPLYTGKNLLPAMSSSDLASMVREARGVDGTCSEYVEGLAAKLRELNIDDTVVSDLAAALR